MEETEYEFEYEEEEAEGAPTGLRALFPARWRGPLQPLDHLWIAILAATARVLHLIIATGNELFHGLFLDAQLYAEAARSIRAGEPDPGPYLLSPLYPHFLSLFSSMDGPAAGNPAYGVRAVQCLLGVLSCVLIGRVAAHVSGRLAGLVAGLIAAMYGPLIHADSMVMLAGPLAFCLTAGIAAAVEAECREERRWWLPAGLALGAAAALRPSALPVGAFLTLVLVVRAARGVPSTPGARFARLGPWLSVALFLIGLAAPMLPFVLHNRRAGVDTLLLTAGGGFNFWIGNHAGATGIFGPPEGYSLALDPVGLELARQESGRESMSASEASDWWSERALEFVAAEPSAWLRLMGRKLALFFHPEEIPQLGAGFDWHRDRSWALVTSIDARWLLLLAILAPWTRELFRRERSDRGRALGHVFGSFVVYALTTCLFFVAGRYRLPIMPTVIALAAITVVEWIHSDSIRRLWILSFLFVFGATSALQYRQGGRFSIEISDSVEERHRGQHLMEEGRLDEAIEVFRASLKAGETTSTRMNLARALRAKGQSEEALLEYQRVLVADPRNALAKFDLGVLLWEDQRDLRNAMRCFRDAVEISPSFHEAWFNLGVVLIAAGEHQEARDVLERALVESSTDVPWRAEAEKALLHCVEQLAKEGRGDQ